MSPSLSQPVTIDISRLQRDGQALPFNYTDAFGREADGVVLRWNGEVRAYRNLCPHWSVPLDGGSGDFFDAAGSVLICDMHGARFDPASGECIMGPCDGDRLEALRVEVSDDGATAHISRGRGLSLS